MTELNEDYLSPLDAPSSRPSSTPTMSNIPVPRITMDYARRGSNTSIGNGLAPTFLAPKPPVSPGAISNCSADIRRFFNPSPSKKVCTMDCAGCRQMARQIREAESNASPLESAVNSAPSSRKASVGIGKT
jgi:hypothetical protein